VLVKAWDDLAQRLRGAHRVLKELTELF